MRSSLTLRGAQRYTAPERLVTNVPRLGRVCKSILKFFAIFFYLFVTLLTAVRHYSRAAETEKAPVFRAFPDLAQLRRTHKITNQYHFCFFFKNY